MTVRIPRISPFNSKTKGYLVGGGKKGKYARSYVVWRNILARTVLRKDNEFTSYAGCSLCDEWYDYQNFAEWYELNFVAGWEVDKDIKCPGNKVYHPDYCMFVPKEINRLFNLHSSVEKELPSGLFWARSGKVEVRFQKFGRPYQVGTFNTVEEGFAAYTIAKAEHIRDVAHVYGFEQYCENMVQIFLLGVKR